MKNIFVFLLFISNLSFGQFSNDICSFEKEIISDFRLPKQYKQELITIKQKFIKKMYADTASELCFGKLYAESYAEYSHRFDTSLYVYDFNYDGKKDILFFGRRCPGYESTDVCIFFRESDNYRMKKLGTWIISMELKKSSFEMTTVKYPCCSDYILQAMKYESQKGNDSIIQLTNQIFVYESCEDQPIAKDTTLLIGSKKELMARPNLNAEELEMYAEEFGAVIGTFQKAITVNSANQAILDGKTWYYVIVPIDEAFTMNENWNNSYFGKLTVARGWICLE